MLLEVRILALFICICFGLSMIGCKAVAAPEEGDIIFIYETGTYEEVDEVHEDGTVYVYGSDEAYEEDDFEED